jgi:hypothetical protein
MRTLRIIACCALAHFALLLAPGCMGASDVVSGGTSGLVEIDPYTAPLAPLEGMGWQAAPAGCEDRLVGEVTFKLASADDGLVAAVDAEGSVVCVDTVESVQDELEEQGEEERAEELGDQFLLAAGLGDLPPHEDFAAGDPTPQPSLDGSEKDDPSPQPSMQPRR